MVKRSCFSQIFVDRFQFGFYFIIQFTCVRKEGQEVGVKGVTDEMAITIPLLDDEKEPVDCCIRYLDASCRTVPSLRLQKWSAAGLDSIWQSRETVEPSGAPINCC